MRTQTNVKDTIFPLIKTLILLFILELMTTAIFPIIGLTNYRIPFNILLVLFMGLRLETPYLSVLIFVAQYFHSFFSVEGWELGTIAGVVICVVVSYVREMIHFSSWTMTILITWVFQILWFFLTSLMIYLRMGSGDYIFQKAIRFLPESIIIAILSPVFFILLNKMWKIDDRGILGESI